MPEILPTTPQLVADETWLLPTLASEPSGGYVGAHSLVIRGAEPVVVDTGCSLLREPWLDLLRTVVEPEDVRWIFLSHDDHDHIGNLDAVLEACPEATLVGNFAMTHRLAGDVPLPLERLRWVEAGESFDAGDRTLTAVRPPLFDSPATRGLHDSATNLLWAVDSFGSLVQCEVYEHADVDPDLYAASFEALNAWNSPWVEWLDRDRFAAHLAETSRLPLDVVVSAHGPVLRGGAIDDAFARTMALAGRAPAPTPGAEVLDLLLAAAALADAA